MKDVLFIMESLDGGGAEKALIEYLKILIIHVIVYRFVSCSIKVFI